PGRGDVSAGRCSGSRRPPVWWASCSRSRCGPRSPRPSRPVPSTSGSWLWPFTPGDRTPGSGGATPTIGPIASNPRSRLGRRRGQNSPLGDEAGRRAQRGGVARVPRRRQYRRGQERWGRSKVEAVEQGVGGAVAVGQGGQVELGVEQLEDRCVVVDD